ncbi:hypothetical protein MANES_09G150601v8 [Manihot esculenta]|uniref:Uncharacterized protein n=1 Tax=Manihot esculenta TaxID=3983 RepID=A0ACB7H6A9_MANES|nr:hypothetical protein MANES_09G150601v8 [Manihot esculenta]
MNSDSPQQRAGIYVGEVNKVKYVIHFITTGTGAFVGSIGGRLRLFYSKIKSCKRCKECGYAVNRGVVKTCLGCFLSGGIVQVEYYNFFSLEPREVVNTAYSLLEHGFGEYDVLANNCEHFATLCKVGEPRSRQVEKVGHAVTRRLPVLITAP